VYFIHIATLSDGEEFVAWLKGPQRVELKDSVDFAQWMLGRSKFPLEFYLDGATYRFDNEQELLMFSLGFETAMRLLENK